MVMVENAIQGKTPVVIMQGAMMSRHDTEDFVNVLNTFPDFVASKSPIQRNIGRSQDHGEYLADTMIEMYTQTGGPGIGIGHSEGGIDWIYAVDSLEKRNMLHVLKDVYFISTPLRRDRAFHADAMPFVMAADFLELFDIHHLLTNDFHSSSQTGEFLSGDLPGKGKVRYVMFKNPQDHVIRNDAMVHPNIQEYVLFEGHPSHIHQLHDEELIGKVVRVARRGKDEV
jgi:hypothetical protein